MTSGRLDQNIERFILACINSVEQLEILLLLRARKELDIDTITQEMRTASTSAEKRMSDLMRKNLVTAVEKDGKRVFQYSPPDNVTATIDQLSTIYSSHRVAVINLIFSKPPDALKGFSDAFRLKE